MLTCKHVVGNRSDCVVTLPYDSARQFAGVVQAVSPTHDLALIRIGKENEMTAVNVASVAPAQGESVTQVGYPGGRGPITRVGKIVRPNGRDMVLSFRVQGGDSGSGVFSPTGLVGVIWGAPVFGSGSYAVPYDAIRTFVQASLPAPARPPQSPVNGDDLRAEIRDLRRAIEALTEAVKGVK